MRCRDFLFIPCVFLLVGCANYEYDITRPSELAQHVAAKSDAVLRRDPLEYRLVTVESRLVMRIYNPTDNSIALVGEKCSAVDPSGQSHPLQTQTIAPHSFIKLIIPPQRPRVERAGPSIGIGVGTMIGSSRYRRIGWNTYADEPRYLTIYDYNDTLYWDWRDESSVRLTLAFQQGEKTFEHEFVLARKKM